MFELTIENYRVCGTVTSYRVKIGDYWVSMDDQGWHCTCKGFQYRKSCKHILEADHKRCAYGWQAVAGSPEPDLQDAKRCPKCGTKTDIMRVAV